MRGYLSCRLSVLYFCYPWLKFVSECRRIITYTIGICDKVLFYFFNNFFNYASPWYLINLREVLYPWPFFFPTFVMNLPIWTFRFCFLIQNCLSSRMLLQKRLFFHSHRVQVISYLRSFKFIICMCCIICLMHGIFMYNLIARSESQAYMIF